jgi:hypothetical protein
MHTLNKKPAGDGNPTAGQHTNTQEVTAKTRAARVYLDLLPEAATAHVQAAAQLDWQAGLARGGAFRAKGTRDAPADPRRIKRRIARHLKKQQASRSKAGTQGGGHV